MTVREKFEVYAKARGFYLARAKSGERTYFNVDTEAIYSTFLAAWTAATEAAAMAVEERCADEGCHGNSPDICAICEGAKAAIRAHAGEAGK